MSTMIGRKAEDLAGHHGCEVFAALTKTSEAVGGLLVIAAGEQQERDQQDPSVHYRALAADPGVDCAAGATAARQRPAA